MTERERDQFGYEIVPKLSETQGPKGYVCGECKRRFEAGKAYGLVCPIPACPMGFGGITCGVAP